jgi:hypothetical protein
VHFKPKITYKDGHFILIKGTMHQEEITIVNIYEPNVSHPTSLNKHNCT